MCSTTLCFWFCIANYLFQISMLVSIISLWRWWHLLHYKFSNLWRRQFRSTAGHKNCNIINHHYLRCLDPHWKASTYKGWLRQICPRITCPCIAFSFVPYHTCTLTESIYPFPHIFPSFLTMKGLPFNIFSPILLSYDFWVQYTPHHSWPCLSYIPISSSASLFLLLLCSNL